MNKKYIAIIYAILAAIFYAINAPLSKLLLNNISATFMASFLYIGAGIGVGIMYLFHFKNEDKSERLVKSDLVYTIGMVILDIIAPILMMIGINIGLASNASLLGNFEIVATTIIALLVFKEKISGKLWVAIGLITISSALLSFTGMDSFDFSIGSICVISATICWGIENNCTRKISNKSTYQIVTIKGLCSGIGSFIVGMILKENFPEFKYIIFACLLGFVAYGLSIFTYVRAQYYLGASKTSAYYAIAPFIGAFLSFIFLKEKLTIMYGIATIAMIVGIIFVIKDTLNKKEEEI